ncbi:MAG TPA: 2-oxoacid:acceptor oxidoreductase family protein [Nitrososphaerales archaeon]|nr:2-oxoacid:acceptor oxidoreductase family protein [Nitrososphaerales archaeon]
MKIQLILSGHGGQGVLELANYIAYYELQKGRHVAYTPSYGPESRGGKVKCYVVASDEDIDSPVVEEPDCLIVMNNPSMDFVPLLKSGGILFMNSSLISGSPERGDVITFKVPATEIADRLKQQTFEGIQDTRIVANSVMFGAYLSLVHHEFNEEDVKTVFGHFLKDRKSIYIPLNLEAARQGFQFERNNQNVPASAQVMESYV